MKTPTALRDTELTKRCKHRFESALRSGREPNLYKIILEVLSEPAPSYFVDYYHASNRLSAALRGEPMPTSRYACASLWSDMLRDLKTLMAKHPKQSFHEHILALCVGAAGRPRFYLTPRRALEIVRPALMN